MRGVVSGCDKNEVVEWKRFSICEGSDTKTDKKKKDKKKKNMELTKKKRRQ